MKEQPDVVIIKPENTETSRQGMPQFFGVSRATAGAKNISMNVTAFGPGGKAKAHYHRDYETAIYGVSGLIALYHGHELENCSFIEPGSFCYIPPFLPHVAFNLSDTEPAVAITARNDAAEQENVILTPELEGRVDHLVAEQKANLAAGRL
jgi:uncharacterized RmlC-like cupin family protein